MTPLWTGEALEAATGGRLTRPAAATGIAIDSRGIAPGDLFVALQAERDGHDFVGPAIAAGAAAAMVHRDLAAAAPLLRVADTQQALTALGAAARARTGARVVAVTGSVGKTTTKEMLRAVLGASGPTHAAVASYNNHWGVPLTLARTPHEAAFAVIEIGMNNPGEIAPLSRLARPHVAVVTSVAAAHIGHLGSLDAIAREKAAIMAGLEPGGIAVLPADSPFLPILAEAAAAAGARVVTFGEGGDARAISVAADAEGSDVEAEIGGTRLSFRLGTPGLHMARNAIAALAAADAIGADVAAGATRLADFRAMPGRGDRRRIATPDGGSALLLDEAYNGQPPSMHAALALLKMLPARRRVAVIGQMGELGAFAEEEHTALAAHLRAAADLVFACGPLMRHAVAALPPGLLGTWTASVTELAPVVARAVRDGDAILVKGSLATGMKTVVQALTESSPA
jgi:UDP-N-acetylmuramoyl-tripeptide--D-alanyl-D-alanine ligase